MSTKPVQQVEPPWLSKAREELGVHETPGPAATERIVFYHSFTTLKATSDEVPWCSSFVCACTELAGIKSTKSAAAKSWLSWGKYLPIEATIPVGAICVIQKKASGLDKATGSSSGYHVGFLLAQNATHVTLLGGNQSDSVKVSTFPLQSYRIAGVRWPLG